jgi:hypothetical protein
MTENEIDQALKSLKWASIAAARPDGRPCAIEATPFLTADEIRFMLDPAGTTKKSLDSSPHALLKYAAASADLSGWPGGSCFGLGRFVHEAGEMEEGWGR